MQDETGMHHRRHSTHLTLASCSRHEHGITGKKANSEQAPMRTAIDPSENGQPARKKDQGWPREGKSQAAGWHESKSIDQTPEKQVRLLRDDH
jgi:hypothetical protein